MNYLYVKYEHYIDFVSENSDRLYKNLKLMTNTKGGELIKEIFNSPIETQFNIEKEEHNLLISFNTNNGYKYRLDIFRVFELDKSDKKINHISFSDYSNDPNDEEKYEELLKRNEMREIINRIHFILIELVKSNKIDNYFCIGGAKLLAKNNIYEYVLKVIVGDKGFDKLKTDKYKTQFGLYFSINA